MVARSISFLEVGRKGQNIKTAAADSAVAAVVFCSNPLGPPRHCRRTFFPPIPGERAAAVTEFKVIPVTAAAAAGGGGGGGERGMDGGREGGRDRLRYKGPAVTSACGEQ